MTHTDFTPLASLAGGAMIGLSAVLLMLVKGRIAGVSGIAARLFTPGVDDEFGGRLAFVIGLVAAPVVMLLATGRLPLPTIETPWALLLPAGFIVGFGAVYGNGCTSGHGVCGLSLLSKRSFLATCIFMGVAAATVFVVRHVL